MSTRLIRLRRWAIILVSVFAVYNVIGFLILPPIVRAQIQERAGAALDRAVTVERVRMNPLSFSIAIHGIHAIDHDGVDLASVGEIYINADPLTSLFKLEWHLSEFRVVEPRKRLVIDEKGVLNVADLITKYSQPSGEKPELSGGIPAAGIDRLKIERWSLDFTDRSRPTPFHTVVGPMTFGLDRFTTRPDASSPYNFVGTTDSGETFVWAGSVSVVPLGSQGRIEFSAFSLPKHMPFVEHLFAGSVKSGRFSFKGDYRIVLSTEPVMQMENATIAVDELSIGERGGLDSLIKLGHFQVDLTRADALQRTAEIAKVAIDGLEVYATRESDGTIDLLRLLPAAVEPSTGPAAPHGSADAPVDPGPAPSATVALIAVTNGRVTVIDRSNPRTARVLLDQLTLSATNAGTDLDREVGLDMSARWNERGTLSATGTVRALPMAAKLLVKGDAIDLAHLDPLVEPFADVRIKSGDIWFAGTVDASMPTGGKLALTWTGDAGLDSLAACEGRGMTELVAWKRLAFTGTEFHLDPLSAAAKEISLVDPVANVAMAEDGTINLLAVLHKVPASAKESTEAAASPAAAAAATKASERLAAATHQKLDFDAHVDLITLSGARVRMADRSFKPGFSTELRDFGGTIRGLSSANLARADVDFRGSLDGVAPLHVSGQINPLADDVYSDIKIAFNNIDLPTFSPYAGRFIGQKIQKGKLRVDLGYKLSQRDLVGENKVLFDQFYLGEKVQSAEAIKLPVGLALALLRDRNGQIPLDVPVRGNLDDPDFKYGRVVWQTIGNILVKAATSPFSLLGGMFGGKDLDLSYVDFASGSVTITEETKKKIEVLTKALFERPALRLEITSPPAPPTDRAGLVNAKFAQMLREEKQRLTAAAAAAPDGAAPDADAAPQAAPVEVAPEEVNALVTSLFVRSFPDEADAAAAVAAAEGVAPIVQPQPAEPEARPGIIRRTLRSLFGGGGKDETEETPAPGVQASDATTTSADAESATPALTLEGMRDRLLASIEVSDEDYRALASARAVAIRDALVAAGTIEAERVFLIDSTTVPEGATGSPDGGRVFFSLH